MSVKVRELGDNWETELIRQAEELWDDVQSDESRQPRLIIQHGRNDEDE